MIRKLARTHTHIHIRMKIEPALKLFRAVFEPKFRHVAKLLCYICPQSLYRIIHKSLRDFRTRLRNNQDIHGKKEHINR